MNLNLSVNTISKKYAGSNSNVISDLSLNVSNGEFVVIVGPSGCGKTTLLRLIAGLESVETGDITINGNRINEIPPAKRNIAMVFQDYALYPSKTVFQNIAFPMKMARKSKEEIERNVYSLADKLEIRQYLNTKPNKLSGGQKQRVAIARALAKDADIVLFDEPLSNLDASLREEAKTLLKELHQATGATFLYVTHDQTEAMELATHIAVMNNGKFEQIGAPREIYKSPSSLFVASFIGFPKINIIENGSLHSAIAHELECTAIEREIVFAIRPENIYLMSPQKANDAIVLNAICTDLLFLGKTTLIKADIDNKELQIALNDCPTEIAVGSRLTLAARKSDILAFDRTTSTRIQFNNL